MPNLGGTAVEALQRDPVTGPADGCNCAYDRLPIAGPVYVSVRFYLDGAVAADTAEDLVQACRDWLATRFPAA